MSFLNKNFKSLPKLYGFVVIVAGGVVENIRLVKDKVMIGITT